MYQWGVVDEIEPAAGLARRDRNRHRDFGEEALNSSLGNDLAPSIGTCRIAIRTA
jgi:hypothetical protein